MILRDGMVISVYQRDEIESSKVIEDMGRSKIENMYPKISVPIGEELLRVENFTIPSRVPSKMSPFLSMPGRTSASEGWLALGEANL